MNIKYLASMILAAFILISCDDNTGDIGSSVIDNIDKLEIKADTFVVKTRSIVSGAVLARNKTGYLGKVRDPETGAYLASSFMTQFYTPENFTFPNKDSIKSVDANGEIMADSCDIRLYYTNYFGDSLSTMKLSAYELSKPIPEAKYYSNFNPEGEYINPNAKKTNKVYTLTDLSVDESTRYGSDYMPSIRIALGKEYGTKIMKAYYEHPEYFRNSYSFIHNLVPGYYFKNAGGIGSMAYITLSQLNVYFRHKTTYTKTDGTKTDTIYNAMASFPGTEEVLQTTNISNDEAVIDNLAKESEWTYLKSPAGIFTEMTLPIDEITDTYSDASGNVISHKNDTINSAKIVLTRINDRQDSKYTLDPPSTLLMIPKGEMKSFFEDNRIADYKTSFLASFNSTSNTYTFNNISGLVKYLHGKKAELGEEWNKVVIIPVSTSYNTSGTSPELIAVTHNMSMTSTRLVGGENSKYGDVKISVIYSKFK